MTDEIYEQSFDEDNSLTNKLLEDQVLLSIGEEFFESSLENNNEKKFYTYEEFYMDLEAFCKMKKIELGDDDSKRMTKIIMSHYNNSARMHRLKPLIDSILSDRELSETSNNLFDHLQENNLENIFFSLDQYDLAVREFCLKFNQELGDDELATIISTLFYQYSGIEKNEILANMKRQIVSNYNQEYEFKLEFSSDKKNDMIQYSARVLANIFPILETISSVSKSNQLIYPNNYQKTEPLIDDYLSEKAKGMSNTLTHFNKTLGAIYFSDVDRNEEEEMEKELNNSFEESFSDDIEEEVFNIFQNSFASIRDVITSRADYRRIKQFSETMKKIVWFLSAYLIAYPKYTFKHSRQAMLENLLEKIYEIYDSIDQSDKPGDDFSPLEKLIKIEKLLNSFLPKAGKKTLSSIVKYSLSAVREVQKEFEQGNPDDEINIIDFPGSQGSGFHEKIAWNYKSGLKINKIINGDSFIKDLATVPFKLIKKERVKFLEAFKESSVVRQFVQFLKSFFKKSDDVFLMLEKERLLKKMPDEMRGKENLYKFFKTVKVKTSKKMNKAYHGLKKAAVFQKNSNDTLQSSLMQARIFTTPGSQTISLEQQSAGSHIPESNKRRLS